MVSNNPWQKIQWEKKPPGLADRFLALRNIFSFNKAVSDDISGSSSLRAALEIYGMPLVLGATPLEEARILLRAACEVEHALLVEYLYAAWSVAPNPAARQILDVAIQEMCHFLTVQNLMLFLGSDPSVRRQDQDPSPTLDPFPFRLRPFSQSVLEDFLLAEKPPVEDMTSAQQAVMKPIIAKHSQQGKTVNPVGLLYAKLYWLFLENDQPTTDWSDVTSPPFEAGRHLTSFPGLGTAKTFQVDPLAEAKWHLGDARGGILANIGSRSDALKALFDIASQGEGLVAASAQQSHFSTFIDVYTSTDFTTLPSANWPTDPFVSSQADPDAFREANRITNPVAVALCGVFDLRYRIALASIRASLSRDRTNASDLVVRTKYVGWAFDEMLGFIRGVGVGLSGIPRKENGQGSPLAAGPTFGIDGFILPEDAAELDSALAALHREADAAIAAALPLVTDAAMKMLLMQMQQVDKKRFPILTS
jgi:Ferritin-like